MTIAQLLHSEKINCFAAIPLENCKITKQRLISDAPNKKLYAIILIMPYPQGDKNSRFAAFSLIPDYHLYFTEILFEKLSRLEVFNNNYMKVFADHSPIDERHAAAFAGLGVIGDNGLFISKMHGSFVFIGEIITSLTEEELGNEGINIICLGQTESCLHCGLCAEKCPAKCISGDKNFCVSHLTQKKGVLSDLESDIIKKSGYVWGCDICALTCPMNSSENDETINPYFLSKRIKIEDYSVIDNMSEAEYSSYAFSWRKKEIIKRNFDLYVNETDNGENT